MCIYNLSYKFRKYKDILICFEGKQCYSCRRLEDGEISFHCILYNIDSLEEKYSRRQLLSLDFQI
jgi:hypothetical protein